MRSINYVIVFVLAAALFVSAGCESFSRKFTRKSKKDKEQTVEMVLAPEDYPASGLTPADSYRQNLLYWGSWYDELLFELSAGGNRKRQLYCLDEAVKSLRVCVQLAGSVAGSGPEGYINKLLKLRGDIEADVYGRRAESFRQPAETLKKEISAYFGKIIPTAPGDRHVD
ncbi:MAG: hypothetical protein WBE75_01515 [Candidatus Omnitrophota bacterium]|jgi:hypothetical protein